MRRSMLRRHLILAILLVARPIVASHARVHPPNFNRNYTDHGSALREALMVTTRDMTRSCRQEVMCVAACSA